MNRSAQWANVLVAISSLLSLGLSSCKKMQPGELNTEPEAASKEPCPADTLRSCAAAIESQDMNLFLRSYAEAIRGELNARKDDIERHWAAFCQVMRRGNVAIQSEKIEGEQARLIATFADEGITREYALTREAGRWTISSPPPLVSIYSLTQELENRLKGASTQEFTPAPSESPVHLDVVRASCKFASRYPDLYNAIERLRGVDTGPPEPHPGAVTIPAGQIAKGLIQGFDLGDMGSVGGMARVVELELLTDVEGCNVPEGFELELLQFLPGQPTWAQYLILVQESVKPGSYHVAFKTRGSGVMFPPLVEVNVTIVESKRLQTVEDVASRYWHLQAAYAAAKKAYDDLDTAQLRLGFREGMLQFEGKAVHSLNHVQYALMYYGSSRYAKDRDVRMALVLMQAHQQDNDPTNHGD